ncbi:universal stress protein [Candidatus Aerophobetes bacterium]|uniref:Universal stress protein n=1 Tax=Aerophobetes bacterium TaxID=2030807 RepID=A0A662D9U4_UNCAE|nr:MAG: universal stress protein [Candidatus Aerophobetes bacterium]
MAKPVERIMVYIDGTEESIVAAQYAIVLAKTLDAELYALYIINIKALEELLRAKIFLKEEEYEYERDLREDAKRYLRHVEELGSRKSVDVKKISLEGSVYTELLNAVKEYGIDLLVLKELSHVRSRREEFYDESERAMRAVPCSVLIVKDEERVWELYESI